MSRARIEDRFSAILEVSAQPPPPPVLVEPARGRELGVRPRTGQTGLTVLDYMGGAVLVDDVTRSCYRASSAVIEPELTYATPEYPVFDAVETVIFQMKVSMGTEYLFHAWKGDIVSPHAYGRLCDVEGVEVSDGLFNVCVLDPGGDCIKSRPLSTSIRALNAASPVKQDEMLFFKGGRAWGGDIVRGTVRTRGAISPGKSNITLELIVLRREIG